MSVDTGTPTTMKIIDNFITNEEADILRNYVLDNEDTVKAMGPDLYEGTKNDSLTGRWYLYNWLSSSTCGSILIPKLTKEFPNLYIRLWANVFRKGEGIARHHHDQEYRLSGNLYLGGPDTATYYEGTGPVQNKTGTLTIFDARVYHWVKPNETETPRVSMAFDVKDWNALNSYYTHTFIPLGTHEN